MDFYHLHQRQKLNDLNTATSQSAKSSATAIAILQRKIEYLNIATLAVGELLEELGISQDRLASKMEEIDLRDGIRDGKFTKTSTCPGCNRKSTLDRVRCMYCGDKL